MKKTGAREVKGLAMGNRSGAGDVPIILAGRKGRLRPTLRAAMVLAQHEGGFDALLAAVHRYDVEVIAEIVALGLDRTDMDRIIEEIWATGLHPLIRPLRRYLVVVHSGGQTFDEQDQEPERTQAERITLAEFCAELAEIGMGWLGWTEEATLSADMNSIRVAYAGRVGMLKAIFGSSEKEETEHHVSTRPMTMELFDAMFGVEQNTQTLTPKLFKAMFGGGKG
ncbi:hypothetical protein M1D80_11010 [Phyllobacteriaceae bacterium JZ32]